MKNFSKLLLVVFFIAQFLNTKTAFGSDQITIPAGTSVSVRFNDNIYSQPLKGGAKAGYQTKDSRSSAYGVPPTSNQSYNVGDKVNCKVNEDIFVNGVVVIKEGASVDATVSALVPCKSVSRPGSITIQFNAVTAIDGSKVPLTSTTYTASGKSGKAVIIALVCIFPFELPMLAVKGPPGVIVAGTTQQCSTSAPAKVSTGGAITQQNVNTYSTGQAQAIDAGNSGTSQTNYTNRNSDNTNTAVPQQQVNSQAAQIATVSDVDINIPAAGSNNSNRFALIIGNEDYSTYQQGLRTEANVTFATQDASIFKDYAIKTLGIPQDNIIFLTNANTRDMNRAIDKMSLLSKALGGDGELYFYYAGHGYPDEVTHEAYIIPVDVNGAELKYALKLKEVYAKLTEFHSHRIVCFLDACFSGGARNQSLMASRGIKIKPKVELISGNMVVFSAVSNDEASLPYKDKAHGLFTYYLLKKLQETQGSVSLGELSDYLQRQVALKSIMVNSQEQTPTVVHADELGQTWRSWKLK